ncbi:very-long-chain enoyl-CoA reductase-like [Platysternon megacephalum]|uniref:Very-long-chain enoyl-CoA reductase-like n=1 Tax=Platysternon megacephalum TaxID=55544 RepID=A0A4D9E7T0_9SAUR|nr:very-long-chain enoyl-CoA reductase-like [Platysternon megacephalum]
MYKAPSSDCSISHLTFSVKIIKLFRPKIVLALKIAPFCCSSAPPDYQVKTPAVLVRTKIWFYNFVFYWQLQLNRTPLPRAVLPKKMLSCEMQEVNRKCCVSFKGMLKGL